MDTFKALGYDRGFSYGYLLDPENHEDLLEACLADETEDRFKDPSSFTKVLAYMNSFSDPLEAQESYDEGVLEGALEALRLRDLIWC